MFAVISLLKYKPDNVKYELSRCFLVVGFKKEYGNIFQNKLAENLVFSKARSSKDFSFELVFYGQRTKELN